MLACERPVSGNRRVSQPASGDTGPVDIVPFRAWHLEFVSVQPEQWAGTPDLSPAYGRALEREGHAFSAFVGMEVIACAGICEFWPGRSQVWALISSKIYQHRVPIHRAVKRYIQRYQCRRLECVIDPQFERAVRWAERLGFTKETPMPGYGFHGETMDMYVRVRS